MRAITVVPSQDVCDIKTLQPGQWGIEVDEFTPGDVWYRTDCGFYICLSNSVHAVIAYNEDDSILEMTKVSRLPAGTKLEITI